MRKSEIEKLKSERDEYKKKYEDACAALIQAVKAKADPVYVPYYPWYGYANAGAAYNGGAYVWNQNAACAAPTTTAYPLAFNGAANACAAAPNLNAFMWMVQS